MRKRFSPITLIATAGVLLAAVMLPSLALADDATPPAETQPVETTPVVESEPEAETTPEPPAEEPEGELSLPEVLEQALPGTQVVVLDENGEPQALATQHAAEALLVGDPIWCPEGSAPNPGNGGCTLSYASMQALIDDINNAVIAEPAAHGIIWIMDGPDTSASNITIDGGSLATWATYRLTLYGGWDGNAGGATPGTSTFNRSLSIVNWQNDVSLNDIAFQNANDSFASLEVETTGDIDVDEVTASNNAAGSGASLDTCVYDSATGLCTGSGDITVTFSDFDDNAFNGLVTDSAGDTSLDQVSADDNGLNGAYITGADDDGTGNVSVQNSQFTGNDSGAGLDVYSDGNVSLNNVIGDSNFTGLLLDATGGTGTITVTTSQASDNDGTGLHAESYGDITLAQFTAERNAADGAYLFAYGTANIFVNTNSHFEENVQIGLFAKAYDGDIWVADITVDGNDVTRDGAFLKTYGSGGVRVDSSSFDDNLRSGLLIGSGGLVDLNGVTADGNGKHGVEVYSTYTLTCHGQNNITVDVDGGTLSNNIFYGLYVAPGATGSLVFTNPTTFAGNGKGDYQLVLEDPDCTVYVKPPSKPLKVVAVPFTGGAPVEQDCVGFSGTQLVLPNGSSVKVGCPYSGETQLEGLEQANLPGLLGAGGSFVLGLSVKLNNAGQPVETLTEGGLLTLSFQIPEGARGRRYSILFWDPTANGGLGAWFQLPPFERGTTFKLNPDDPDDGRTIFSGVRQVENTVQVTVDFPGVFILASN